MPLKRLCDPAPLAPSRWRTGAAVPRTPSTVRALDDLTYWSTAPFPAPVELVLREPEDARATVQAVERFYTTVDLNRERATEGWRRSTLTTKET